MSDEATVERVARAIYEEHPETELTGRSVAIVPWDGVSEDIKTISRRMAAAAIAALLTQGQAQ